MVKREVDCGFDEMLGPPSAGAFVIRVDTRHANNFSVVPVGPNSSRDTSGSSTTLTNRPFRRFRIISCDFVDVLSDGSSIVLILLQRVDHLAGCVQCRSLLS